MSPQIKIVETPQGIEDLLVYLDDKDLVAYDCETDGVQKNSTVIGISVCADEFTSFYVILRKWVKDELVQVVEDDLVKVVLEVLATKQLICHNAVFDCAMAENFFGVDLTPALHTDTMLLAHLLNENRRIGLKELAKEYFGADAADAQAEMKASVIANGGRLTKDHYEMYKCDSQILAKYGAMDALLTYQLFYQLMDELVEKSNLMQFFYDDETMPLLKGATYHLNNTGLKVDTNALLSLKKQLEAECEEAKAFIYTEIQVHIKDKYPGTTKKNQFNIGSSQQLAWLLYEKLGLEFGRLTDGGKDICKALNLRLPYTFAAKKAFAHECQQRLGQVLQPEYIHNGQKKRATLYKDFWAYTAVDKKTLTKLAPKFKWIDRLLEYQRKNKILNTYVEGIESRTQYGVIHPSFLQAGTTSGRYSSRNPNFQNLPRDDKRVKACIVARPGKVFVGADYSQLEPRVFAFLSQDERLMKAFEGANDFYSVIGMGVYNKTDCLPLKEGHPDAFGIKYKKLRDLSKVIALASTYGATAHQLAPTTGKSIEDTQADMDNYFEEFPKVATFMLDSHTYVKTHGEVVTHFGRPRRLPEALKIKKLYGNQPHAELPYEIRNVLNLSVNHRVQGTGASIVNRAAIAMLNEFKANNIEARLVVQVHDSLVVECDEADGELVSHIMQLAMEETVILPGVKLEAQPKIGKNLSEV